MLVRWGEQLLCNLSIFSLLPFTERSIFNKPNPSIEITTGPDVTWNFLQSTAGHLF